MQESEVDFQHKQLRLQELSCQLEDEQIALAELQNNFLALKEELKCVGEPNHYKYLLNEAECDVQRLKDDIERLTCEDKKLKSELADVRNMVNATYHQLSDKNAKAYEIGLSGQDLAPPHHSNTVLLQERKCQPQPNS